MCRNATAQKRCSSGKELTVLPAAPRVLDEPMDLHHQFIVGNTNISAKVVWAAPVSEVPVVAYVVVWGQVLTGTQFLLLDWTTVVSKTVAKVFFIIYPYFTEITANLTLYLQSHMQVSHDLIIT